MKTLGQTIRLLREANGFTAVELAHRAGITKSYVSLIENDNRSPSVETMPDIASSLNVPLEFLVEVAAASGASRRTRRLHGLLGEFEALEKRLNRLLRGNKLWGENDGK